MGQLIKELEMVKKEIEEYCQDNNLTAEEQVCQDGVSKKNVLEKIEKEERYHQKQNIQRKQKQEDFQNKNQKQKIQKESEQENLQDIIQEQRRSQEKLITGQSIEEESMLSPQVLEFLDQEGFAEKLDYLTHTLESDQVNEQDLDVMAVSVDVVLKEGDIEEKLEDLIRCVSRLARWEIQGIRRS